MTKKIFSLHRFQIKKWPPSNEKKNCDHFQTCQKTGDFFSNKHETESFFVEKKEPWKFFDAVSQSSPRAGVSNQTFKKSRLEVD